RRVAAKVLERYKDSINSIADLYRFISDQSACKGLVPRQVWQNSDHLISELGGLATVKPLNATTKDVTRNSTAIDHAITSEESLTRPGVTYWWLPATVDGSQSTNIIRLRLLSLIAGAGIFQGTREKVDVVCVVDEAQQIATQGLPLILNQARSLR